MSVKPDPKRVENIGNFHTTTIMAVITTLDAAYSAKTNPAIIADLWVTGLKLISQAAFAKAHAAAIDGLHSLPGETVEEFPSLTYVGMAEALRYAENSLKVFSNIAECTLPLDEPNTSEVMREVGVILRKKNSLG